MMDINTSTLPPTDLLGTRAPNRGPVDLLAEASRLKFSVSEIAELERLYEKSHLPHETNSRQNDK